MTYEEVKQRLSKCERTLELIKNGSYKNLSQSDSENKIKKLQTLKESLEKLLSEAGKKTAFIDGRPVDVTDKDDLDQFKDNTDIDSIEFQGKKIKEMDRPPYTDIKPGSREDSMNRSYERLSPDDKKKLQQMYDMLEKERNESVKDDEHDTGDIDVGHQDDEPDMLQATAFETAQYAAKLVKKLQKYDDHDGEVDFPNWWQSKLILAKDYMQKAYHYLDSEEKQPAIDQLALEENTMNEGRSLSDIKSDIDKVKKLAPQMNKLPQDDPKRQAFIKKVKSLNQEKKDYEAGVHSKVKKTGADQEVSDVDEAQPTGFGTGQGRSKTISKGREERPDLAQARKDAVKPKKKYVMKNGVPHKYDADGNLVPLKKINEYRGVMDDIIEIIKDMAMNADGDEEEAAMEVMEFIGEHYKIDFEFGRAGGGNYGRNDGAPYEDVNEAKATCCGRCGRVHVKEGKCTRSKATGSDRCDK